MRIKSNRWCTTAGGVLVVACGVALAVAQAGYTTLSGRVIGRAFAWPAAMAPAAGLHQQLVLLRLDSGAGALVAYRFARPENRLKPSFFDPRRQISLAVEPLTGCPAKLRDLVFLRTTARKSGAPVSTLALARLPGVPAEAIAAHLDDALACYLALPGSIANGETP